MIDNLCDMAGSPSTVTKRIQIISANNIAIKKKLKKNVSSAKKKNTSAENYLCAN